MNSRLWKSRLPGPFLVSFVLCFTLIDYIIYSQTSDSLLGWLWKFIAFLVYLFQMLPLSQYFSAMGIFILGAVVLFCVIVWLSKDSATRAMEAATEKIAVNDGTFQNRAQAVSAVNYAPRVVVEQPARLPVREPQNPPERPSLHLFRNAKDAVTVKSESIESESPQHETPSLRTRLDSAVASVRESFEWKMPALGITGKLVGIFAIVAALFGVGATLIVYSLASGVFETQINERADITAMNLSETLAGPVAEKNLTGIRHELDSYVAQQDVAYAFVQDEKGNVLAATTTQLPTQTSSVLQPPSRFDRWTALVFQNRPVYETRAVILDGKLGILHLGIWKRAVENEIRGIFWPIAYATGLVVILSVLTFRLAIGRIGRLLLQLAECANRISEGDLGTSSWINRRDELGKLAISLERIRASLKAATRRLEKSQPAQTEPSGNAERVSSQQP